MNLNNFLRTFFFATTIIFAASSCKKLEEKAFSQNAPDNFFGSKSDVAAALTGMYRPLQVCCEGYQQSYSFALNIASDDGGSGRFEWGYLDELNYSPTNTGDIFWLWATPYIVISSANFVIDNEAKIEALDNTPDKSFVKASIGEAKFMRALNYFQLVQCFGGVPLRTSVTSRADQTQIPRNTEEEVYAQIIEDFKYAEENLPVDNIAGKPTKWAASAFLAKVFLTKKDYPNALAQARAVVASGKYSLQPTFASVFDVANENNAEVIFDIQYIRQDGQGMRMQYLFTGFDDDVASGGSAGWGLATIENHVYESFDAGDDRLATTFTDPAPGLPIYYPGKWRDPEATLPDGHENNFIVYRYSDLVLILAEAANEVDGPGTEAYDAIDLVRDRAQLGGLTPGLTKDQFRDAVIEERLLELSFEQHRWFDLKRTGKLKDALIATNRPWNDKFWLFPIPQGEIDASNGLIEQNPGY